MAPGSRVKIKSMEPKVHALASSGFMFQKGFLADGGQKRLSRKKEHIYLIIFTQIMRVLNFSEIYQEVFEKDV